MNKEQRLERLEDALRLRANRIRRAAMRQHDRSGAGAYVRSPRVYRFNRAFMLDVRADRLHKNIRRLARQRLNEVRSSYGLGAVTWQ